MVVILMDIEDAKALLDIATNSMDFGSGFLEHAEVETMRRIAVAVGVDPMAVTPSNFVQQWAHEYNPVIRRQWTEWDPTRPRLSPERLPDKEVCSFCSLGSDDRIHHGIDNLPKEHE